MNKTSRRKFALLAIASLLWPTASKAKVCMGSNAIYPVGSIYLSILATNPRDLLGFGTWERFGQGRALVGVHDTDPDFAFGRNIGTKMHTLTEAEMPRHSHNITTTSRFDDPGNTYYIESSTIDAGFKVFRTDNSGNSQPHNNLQPYITVYMWRRVS